MQLKNWYSDQEFDKIVAILGAIFSLFLFVFLSINIDQVIYILTSVFTLISCILWLLIRENASLKFKNSKSISSPYILLASFFIVFAFSVLSFYFRPSLYERPLIYFIFLSSLAGIIALETIYFERHLSSLILFQIILLGMSIAWSQLLIFPGLLGLDPWRHQMFSLDIINTGRIPLNFIYSKMPFFHLNIISVSLLSGVNYKFATMLSVSLTQIICNVTFVFLLAKYLFRNSNLACLASLLLIIANYHIYMSYWSIPNSFASVFILVILYALLKLKKDKPVIASFLLLICMVSLVSTHTISSMCMSITLLVLWAVSIFYNLFFSKKDPMSYCNYSILFTVYMFAFWSFVSGSIHSIGMLIKWGFSIDLFRNSMEEVPESLLLKYIVTASLPEQIFSNFGMFLFFSMSFIGFFYMISKKYGNYNTFSMAIIGITPLFIAFFSLITQHSIIEQRWFFFAQIFLSIPLAISILILFNVIKNNNLKNVFMFVFIFILSFFLIISPTANIDNDSFSPNGSSEMAFTESELQAIKTISNFWLGTIKSDRAYFNTQDPVFNIEQFDSFLCLRDVKLVEKNLVLVREKIIGNSFIMFDTKVYLDYNLKDFLDKKHFLNIYDCGSVNGYIY